MSRTTIAFLVLSTGPLWLIGCTPSSNQQVTVVPTSSAPPIKSIANVEYESWAKHPVGTRVVREKVMENDVGRTVVTTSLELKEVQSDAVIVVKQTTVERTNDKTVNPPEEVTFKAKHSIPENMEEELFQRPFPDAKPVGHESIESGGKSYNASVYEWKSILESGPMPVKGWFSSEFPGRQIRLAFQASEDQTFYEETKSIAIPDKPQ